MAVSDYFCDYGGGDDTTGNGTIGTPWKTIQKAFNTITRNSTDGDRVNVKAGTAQVLSAALTLATYGTPTLAAPLYLEGYTSAQGDGGIGDINGNAGNFNMWTSNYNYRHIRNMIMRNTGNAVIFNGATFSTLYNCELHTSSNGAPIVLSHYNRMVNCYVHGMTGAIPVTLSGNGNCILDHCLIDHTYATTSGIAVSNGNDATRVSNCIVIARTSAIGIRTGQRREVQNCAVWSNGGNGIGIQVVATNQEAVGISNCVIAGFSGSGGIGLDVSASGLVCSLLGPNIFYDNDTDMSGSPKVVIRQTDTTGGGAPFANPGSGDFTLADEYKALGWPDVIGLLTATTQTFIDPGAAQRDEDAGASSGGGQLVNAGLVG